MGGLVEELRYMRSRAPGRWGTKFGRWALEFGGPGKIAVEISRSTRYTVTPAAVYHWIAGRNSPRHEHAVVLARISCGAVTIDDVHVHREVVTGRVTPREEE